MLILMLQQMNNDHIYLTQPVDNYTDDANNERFANWAI